MVEEWNSKNVSICSQIGVSEELVEKAYVEYRALNIGCRVSSVEWSRFRDVEKGG